MLKSNTANKKNIVFIIIITIFFLFDRYLKQIAISANPNLNLLGENLKFVLSKNFNIAFSLPLSGSFLSISITLLIIILIIFLLYLIKKRYSIIIILSLFTLILGATSNALDRLVYGYVIDYLDVFNFTILNIADILISLGAMVLIITNFKNDK